MLQSTKNTKNLRKRVIRHTAELAVTVSAFTAVAVIVHYKHKYGGDILFTVSADTMNSLHNEGVAVLQELGKNHYTLSSVPVV